uniref:Uncharacterized protein n=1 Tax=viral metagenome TaxID=1070528 RepID=A0A6C0DS70_9ZZZZ
MTVFLRLMVYPIWKECQRGNYLASLTVCQMVYPFLRVCQMVYLIWRV